jgi:hypothetical protein
MTSLLAWRRRIRRIGLDDITRIERSGRNLVEQGLEQVMVSPIDERDPHRRTAERTRRGQAAEPAANDHNVWKTHRRFH